MKSINISKAKISKLSIVSFAMLLVGGAGFFAIEYYRSIFESHIEITDRILLAYISFFVFGSLIPISFLLGLISIFRVTIKKQRGGIWAILAVILSFIFLLWAFVSAFAPSTSEYYGPTVSGEVQN